MLLRAGGGVSRKATGDDKDTSLRDVQTLRPRAENKRPQRKRILQGSPQEHHQEKSFVGNRCSSGLPGHPTCSC